MVTKSIDFSNYSAIKIGPIIDVEIIDSWQWNKCGYFIIGGANNLLLSNKPKKLAKLSKKFDYIKIENGKMIIGAATSSGKVLSFVKKHNIANFEFLSKLPGLIGGMLKMNAGLKEWEIFNNLISIKTNRAEIIKSDIPYSYRYTKIDGIILEATFNIKYGYCQENFKKFIKMRENQPQLPSAGSCFKNPKPYFAAKLIEDSGLKGMRIGNMGFSDKHANFLVNYGNGSFEEAIELIELAKNRVKKMFNVVLEEEIIIIF